MTSEIDPLIAALVLAGATRWLEAPVSELVHLVRRQGHRGSKIGQALGVARQTAWERYSGEE